MDRTVDALAREIAQAQGPVVVRGGRTKPGLGRCAQPATSIDRDRLPAGIVAYDPSEFLITAGAATPIAELQQATAEHGQYLPFDPLFAPQGATLGGTVAAGISGPNQLLHGRIRDFVMEVECVDGLGRCVRGGGKVVKNAAGFDLPKLMVASYGRLGIITEVTLKVLPRPAATQTVVAQVEHPAAALDAMQRVAGQPLPLAATEYLPDGRLLIRFAGPAASLPRVIRRAGQLLDRELSELGEPGRPDASGGPAAFGDEPPWLTVRAQTHLLYAVHPPSTMPALIETLTTNLGMQWRSVSALGSASWWEVAADPDFGRIGAVLRSHRASAVVVRGPVTDLTLVGDLPWLRLGRRIAQAVDPRGIFPEFTAADAGSDFAQTNS